MYMFMRREGRKKQARLNKHKIKQYNTPKSVNFPKKNELPRVGHVHVHLTEPNSLGINFRIHLWVEHRECPSELISMTTI